MNFVVYLTKYSGNLLPPYYIGSTSKKRILSGKYYGSPKSKKYKNVFIDELKKNPHLFSVEILSYHVTREESLIEELRIQIKNDVVKSDLYFNKALASSNGMFGMNIKGENNPFYGKTHSKEFKEYLSKIKKGKETWMKGKKHSKDSIIKNANNHKTQFKNFIKILDGKIIGKWERPFELKRDHPNLQYGNIIQCCKGKLKSAYGFIWKADRCDE